MNISISSYNNLSQSDDEWFCLNCSLPKFSDSFFEENVSIDVADLPQNTDLSETQNPVQEPNKASEFEHNESKCLNKKGFLFIHLNVRSLRNKLSELQLIANQAKVAVISVTESWFDESIANTEVSIPGYSIIRKDRNCCGGGVCMYIRDDLVFAFVQLDSTHNTNEIVCVELLLPKSKPIIVGTCYRSPWNNNFINKFEIFLSQLREDCEMILLGDFSICYGDQKGPLFKLYDSVLKIFNLCQMIKQPTRVTEFTSSVIDHILCNNPEKNCQSGVLNMGISDHFIVYCTRKLPKSSFNKHNNVKVRSVKSYNKDVFIEKLTEAKWESCFFLGFKY
jgi:hypothetical protein